MLKRIESTKEAAERLADVMGVESVVISKESTNRFEFMDFCGLLPVQAPVSATEHSIAMNMMNAMAVVCMFWLYEAKIPSMTLSSEKLGNLPDTLGLRSELTEDDMWQFVLIDMETGEDLTVEDLAMQFIEREE